MFRKFLFLILIFPFSLLANNFELSWFETDSVLFGDKNIAGQSFEGGIFMDGNQMPYFTYSLPLKADKASNYSFEVTIEDLQESLLDAGITLNEEEIRSDYKLISNVVSSRKAYSLEIIILPFRNSDAGIQRLESFNLSIKETPVIRSKSTTSWFASQSVLSEGNWIKVGVTEDGIYKLTYSQLSDMGVDPAKVSIFTSHAGQLGTQIYDYTDDLKEIPIYDGDDYILFYGQSHNIWTYNAENELYEYEPHHFWNENYYFISSDYGEQLRITTTEETMGTSSHTFNTFVDYAAYAPLEENILHSGDDWFSNSIGSGLSFSHQFSFDDIVSSTAHLSYHFAYTYPSYGVYSEILINDDSKGSIYLSSTSSNVGLKTQSLDFVPNSNSIDFDFIPNTSSSDFTYWIGNVQINVECPLSIVDNSLLFRNKLRTDDFVTYEVSNASSNTLILDITDIFNVQKLNPTLTNATVSFVTKGDEARQFVALDKTATFPSPNILGSVENQNLHGEEVPNMVIVSPVEFFEPAERLADIHREEGLSVLVIDQQSIFNEFSGGKADITAIRWFMKMFYDRSDDENSLDYLLLFGDASYDNRMYETGSSVVMTYQSDDSFTETGTYVSDDYFGLLDDTEGNGTNITYSDKVDIGIGRIPVNSVDEADEVVDKIDYYLNDSKVGDWRNTVTFLSDDQDNNAHLECVEYSSYNLQAYQPQMSVKKIFTDAFVQEVVAGSNRYPEAKAMSDSYLEDGTLIWAYAGHGSPVQLANEMLMSRSQVLAMTNLSNLPFWLTATCDFCPFDHNDEFSAGEAVMLNSQGGGIGLFTTTRVVYISENETMTRSFFDYVMAENPANGERYRIGDTYRLAKKSIGTGANKRKYCLIGDPALKLLSAEPEYEIITESINGVDVVEFTDTLSALEMVTVSGYIQKGTEVDADYNGIIFPTMYDKILTMQTLGNDDDSQVTSFSAWNSVVFKGQATVENGRFEFSFLMPKDIDYTSGKGRIEYYASGDQGDANGYYDDFYIGLFNEDYEVDTIGPDITSYMNISSFKDGATVNSSPLFIADISDKSGINTSGSSIGHDITLVTNDDSYSIVNLNNNYESLEGDFTEGRVTYQFSDLEEGQYNLCLKVWDVHNNSSTSLLTFNVVNEIDPVITSVLAKPNPLKLSSDDALIINVTHDRPETALSTRVDFFTIDGRKIHTTSQNISTSSNTMSIHLSPYEIFSKGGLYLYRVSIDDGTTVSEGATQKVLVLD